MALMVHLLLCIWESARSSIGANACSCVVIALCLFNFRDVTCFASLLSQNMALLMQVLIPVLLPPHTCNRRGVIGRYPEPGDFSSRYQFLQHTDSEIDPSACFFFSCIFIFGNSLPIGII